MKRARTTYQRLSDAKFFNGWVRRISPSAIVVFTTSPTPMEAGDKFSFHVFGNMRDAFFSATLTGMPEIMSQLTPPELGRNGREYVCTLDSDISFKKSAEQARFCVDEVSADIVGSDGHRIEQSAVLDIGPAGFASVTDRTLKKGEQVQVVLYTSGLLVAFLAEVRNTVSYGGESDYQRTGFQITRLDRVNSVRWKQFYLNILEDSRVGWDIETAEIGSVVKLKSRKVA